MKELRLGGDKPPVTLSPALIAKVEEKNRFILIGRPLIPQKQSLPQLLKIMPRTWNLEGQIHGRIVEGRKFQFIFPNEEALSSVIRRGPWNFHDRMIVIQRWTPFFNPASLNFIPFWIQIRGIPFQLIDGDIVYKVGRELGNGDVIAIDLNNDPAYPNNSNFVRVCINWFVNDPIELQRSFQFIAGENTILRLKFERLKNYCEECGSLTHDTTHCPNVQRNNNGDNRDDGDDQDDSEAMDDFPANRHLPSPTPGGLNHPNRGAPIDAMPIRHLSPDSVLRNREDTLVASETRIREQQRFFETRAAHLLRQNYGALTDTDEEDPSEISSRIFAASSIELTNSNLISEITDMEGDSSAAIRYNQVNTNVAHSPSRRGPDEHIIVPSIENEVHDISETNDRNQGNSRGDQVKSLVQTKTCLGQSSGTVSANEVGATGFITIADQDTTMMNVNKRKRSEEVEENVAEVQETTEAVSTEQDVHQEENVNVISEGVVGPTMPTDPP